LFQIPQNIWFGKRKVIETSDELSIGSSASASIHPLDESKLIEQQIQLRNDARAKKDFSTADTIRKELAKQGIILEDRPDGTTRWKR
jgi:cysteinyl-tRNA synthetase